MTKKTRPKMRWTRKICANMLCGRPPKAVQP